MGLIWQGNSPVRTLGSYGDEASSRMLYYGLHNLDRNGIFRMYGDSPPAFASAIRYAVTLEVSRPFGSGDLSTAARFLAEASSVENPAVRSFIDIVLPPGDPSRARLPLRVHRTDFAPVLKLLVTLDQGYRGRVLLMRAFVVLATDFNLMPVRS